jgi:hypothetical protein
VSSDSAAADRARDRITDEAPVEILAPARRTIIPAPANRAPRVYNISPDAIDLAAVQRDWENHLDALLGVWVGITADQRD